MNYTFPKEERLCSERLIDSLFHNGSSFVVYPYRVVFLPVSDSIFHFPVQSIISVSKRRFKRAVDRNYLKRRMREAYRLQKSILCEELQEQSLHLLLAFQYVGKEKLPYAYLYSRMGDVINKLKDECIKVCVGKGN